MGNNTKQSNKISQVREVTNNKSKFKKGFIIALEIITLIVTFSVILLIYLHHSRFKVVFHEMKLNDYFTNGDIGKIIDIKGNNIAIEIPSDVINTSFNDKIKELQLQKGYKIREGYINTGESKAYINMTLYGINIPIAMDIVLENNSREVTMTFKNMTLRNKRLLSLPKSVEESLLKKLGSHDDLLKINLDNYKIPEIAIINNIILQQDKIQVILSVDEEKIKELLKKISTIRSDEIYGIYKNQTEAIKQKTVQLMDQSMTLSKMDIENILSDILIDDEELIRNVLTITNENNIDDVLDNYGRYITHFSKKNIINDKNKLILGKIEKYCSSLLEHVGKLPNESYIVYLNNPYSLVDHSSITVEDMVTKYELNIPEDIYNKMSFLYNYENKNFMISYEIEDKEYAIVDNEDYRFINKDTYKSYDFDEPLENQIIYDEEIEAKIAKYFSGEVFIRYMNSDGKYAYVIASDANNYQDYERFALEKKEEWEIVDTNISDLYVFSIKHPGFNIRTIADNFLNDTVYKLSKADVFAVMDQLEYREIIPDKEEVGLKYCSFDGKYIALKLTNDEEYVFSIKYSYLDKVYKKNEAINKWKDISPLILLQDKNVHENEIVLK